MAIDPQALERQFADLVEHAPAQRADALRALAQNDAALATRLALLLDAHQADTLGLDALHTDGLRRLGGFDATELIGRELGGWTLTSELGRGGMGVVYAGERERDGVRQRAAIKLLSVPVFDAEAGQRFVREAAVLARLDHPGICRLRDFGRSDEGWPYLVLDLIDGEPIATAAARLPMTRRIEFIAQVAEAVGAAHRQLVVHLDIKPDNILIDGRGRPVLLDFGVSRVLAEEGAGATVTLTRWLTPDYASPEQLRGEPATVAADLYALGAVLYELVVGRPPFDLKRLSVTEALRQIERGAPMPSRLASGVPGDLDAVIGKAMHADPSRRYASADAFAEDLRAVLARRPVAARPDSAGYRLRKLVQRNPIAAPATVLALLAITVLAILLAVQANDLTRQRDRAEREAVRARAATDLLLDSIKAADPAGEGGAELKLSELLDATEAKAEIELSKIPALHAETLVQLADVRRALGQHTQAAAMYEQARALLPGQSGWEGVTERAAAGYAEALLGADRVDEAIEEARTALDEIGGEGHWRLWLTSAKAKLAQSLQDEAESDAQRALLLVPEDQRGARAEALRIIGNAEAARDRDGEAVLWFERARSLIANDPAERGLLATVLADLSWSLQRGGAFDAARAAIDETLAIRIELYGESHPEVVSALLDLCYVLSASGAAQEGIETAERAMAIERDLTGGESRRMERLLVTTSMQYRRMGDSDQALPYVLEALALAQRLYPSPHRSLANAHSNLATLYADRSELEQALEHNFLAWSMYDELSGEALSRGRVVAAINIASNHGDLEQYALGYEWSTRALGEGERLLTPDDWVLANIRMIHAKNLIGTGRHAEAEALLLEVARVYEASTVPVPRNARHQLARRMVELYTATAHPELAAEYQRQVEAFDTETGS